MSKVKWKLTRSEYLQLTGLLALGRKHVKITEDIEREACKITGEEYGMGHTSDAFYEGYTVEELLERIKLRNEKKK